MNRNFSHQFIDTKAVVDPDVVLARGVELSTQWGLNRLYRKFLNFKSKNVHFVHFCTLILKFAG